jgi:hypothetical protein
VSVRDDDAVGANDETRSKTCRRASAGAAAKKLLIEIRRNRFDNLGLNRYDRRSNARHRGSDRSSSLRGDLFGLFRWNLASLSGGQRIAAARSENKRKKGRKLHLNG